MKLIFLDIDGVLNTGNSMHVKHRLAAFYKDNSICRDKYGHLFDETSVEWLELLILLTEAKIVISSTWRYSGLDEMRKMWLERKLPGEIIGITPCGQYRVTDEIFNGKRTTARGYEIKQFLHDFKNGNVPKTHCIINEPTEVESYVIFDDDSDMLTEQLNSFCHTDNMYGLIDEYFEKALSILNA